MACSRPGMTFATTENPWQAGVLGKMGPYRPFSSVKYPSFGIAIAAGFVQSVSLGLAGAGVAMKVSLEGCCILVSVPHATKPSDEELSRTRCFLPTSYFWWT